MPNPSHRPSGERAPADLPRLAADPDALAARLRDADGLVLCADFDGTLAPIVERPDEAAILPGARERLADIAATSGVAVAVVSGRAAADVRDRVGVPGVRYVGNHGLERAHDGDVESLAPPREQAAVAAALDRLEARLADVAGALVERKGPTGTVHYREVRDVDVPAVEAAVSEVVGAYGSLAVHEGKAVFEVRPVDGPDKGDAVASVHEAAEPSDEDWLLAFVGDDESDEAAFEAVVERGGVAVGVGRPADTAATHWVPDPEGVLAVLDWLVADGLGAIASESKSAAEPEPESERPEGTDRPDGAGT